MLSSLVTQVWDQVLWAQACYVTNSKASIQDVEVTNTAINQLPSDAQLVITQKN